MKSLLQKLFTVVLSLALIALCWLINPQGIFAYSGYGDGTSSSPYLIQTCSQLQEMANNLSAYYKQLNDIDCTGVSFAPIGDGSTPFTGNFNGQNFAITNIAISTTGDAGFFGQSNGATIQNLRLVSGSVVTSGTSKYIGSIVGKSGTGTTISHSMAGLTITLGDAAYLGGLVGWSVDELLIEKSYFSGNMTGTNKPSSIGGLLCCATGSTNNNITDSYATGTWNQNTDGYGGGLIGLNYNSFNITRSYVSATVDIGGFNGFGGFIGGFNGGTVLNSFAAITRGTTSGNAQYGGGFWSGQATSTNNYYDSYLFNYSTCSRSGSANCTAVNASNATPNYFKGNSANAPLDTWNFTTIWQTNTGAYPTLRGFSSPATQYPPSTSAPSAAPATPTPKIEPPKCPDSKPTSAPSIFQISSTKDSATIYFAPITNANKYFISYGYTSGDNRFGVEFTNSQKLGIISYTLGSLSPNATYYFRVRAGNGCMPGEWGNEIKATTSKSNVASLFYPDTPQQTSQSTVVLGANTEQKTKTCEYIVQSGDSLWKIASQKLEKGSLYHTLMQQNNLQTHKLKIGQKVNFPCI